MFEPEINSHNQYKKQSEIKNVRFGAVDQTKNAFEIQSAFARQSEIKTEVLPQKKTEDAKMRMIEPIAKVSEKSIWRPLSFFATVAFCGLILFFSSALIAFFVSPMFFQTGVKMFGGGVEVEREVKDEFGARGNTVPLEEENYAETSNNTKKTEDVFNKSKLAAGKKSPNAKNSVNILSELEVQTERAEKVFSIEKSQPTELQNTRKKVGTNASDRDFKKIPDNLPDNVKKTSGGNFLKSKTNFGEKNTPQKSPILSDQKRDLRVSARDRVADGRQGDTKKKRETTRNKRVSDKKVRRFPKNRPLQTRRVIRRKRRPN